MHMRTFLRHVATGHYFQSLEKWTLDRDEAYDFGFVSKALKVAQKLRMRELELELSFEDPEQAATPFEKLMRGFSRRGKQPFHGRRASHRSALA
jgi:hypothetical protein